MRLYKKQCRIRCFCNHRSLQYLFIVRLELHGCRQEVGKQRHKIKQLGYEKTHHENQKQQEYNKHQIANDMSICVPFFTVLPTYKGTLVLRLFSITITCLNYKVYLLRRLVDRQTINREMTTYFNGLYFFLSAKQQKFTF